MIKNGLKSKAKKLLRLTILVDCGLSGSDCVGETEINKW